MDIATLIIALSSFILVLIVMGRTALDKDNELAHKDIISGTRENLIKIENRLNSIEKRLPWGDITDERDFKLLSDSHWQLNRVVAEIQKKLE